jgi:integrase
MATSRLVIKKKYLKKNGYTPIYIQYIFKSDEKVLINTGYEILPEHWNPVTQSVRDKADNFYDENFAVINSALFNVLNDFKKFLAVTFNRKLLPTIKFVKDHFQQYLINKHQSSQSIPDELITIYDHIKDYIENKKEEVAKDTLKDYRSLIKHLKQFEKARGVKIDFTSFDYNFYDTFIDFLYYETEKPNGEKGLLTNAVGKQIKNLKAFLRDRIRKGFCANIDLSTYKTVTEEVDRIYLSWADISMIYHFDLSGNDYLNTTRDLLVLGCLIGLRFSDLSRIVPEYILNGNLRIRQKKVKKNVQIPIMADASTILKKYNWYAPNIPMHEFNKNLKILGEIVGLTSDFEMIHFKKGKEYAKKHKKFELLSSHICRRSFCTNEYLDGTDIHLIMRISGHRTEKAFLTYLKMDEVVASQKIAEKWKNRSKL